MTTTAKKGPYLICGCGGSGTMFTYGLFQRLVPGNYSDFSIHHPVDKNVNYHLSWPHGRPFGYHPPHWFDGYRKIVLFRSPVHVIYSAWNHWIKPDGGTPAEAHKVWWRGVHMAAATVFLSGGMQPEASAFVMFYEDWIHRPDELRQDLASFTGVEAFMTEDLGFKSANDDRWKQDPVFYEYIRDKKLVSPLTHPTWAFGHADFN